MKRFRSRLASTKGVVTLALAGVLTASLAVAGTANAAVVTVGIPLNRAFESSEAETESFIVVNKTSAAGIQFASPVTGAVIRWNVAGGKGPLRLGVLRPAGGLAFTLTRRSAIGTPPNTLIQTFTTALPITAGETVGLEVPIGSTVGLVEEKGDEVFGWQPALAEGATQIPTASQPFVLGFNAEVLPAPTIASITAASGPTSGGSAVTIFGTDFTGVSAVKFGALPASSFIVANEGAITAVAPPSAAGAVPVTVTTPAGTATAAQPFTYAAPPPPPRPTCTVPRLKGKTLKSAKKRIRAADCGVGKLTKKEGATAKTGEVVKQVPKPGVTVPADTKVKVTLAP